jgi:hypothetical protein
LVTEPTLPLVVLRATVPPLAVRLFPLASLSWTVIVEVLEPFATIEVGDAVIWDVAVAAGPGVKVTTSLSVIAFPFRVPVIVALPAVVDEVRVAL